MDMTDALKNLTIADTVKNLTMKDTIKISITQMKSKMLRSRNKLLSEMYSGE